MNRAVVLSILMTLLLTGCEYEFPLTKEHHIPVDSAVLGLWEVIECGSEKPDQRLTMMILKYSDTEYMVHYPVGEAGIYFRGYPIKIGGVSCVQLQVLGADSSPPGKEVLQIFHVASYQLTNGKLVIKLLNTHLVENDLKDSDALKKAFVKYKNDKELFTDPCTLRKIAN